MEIAIKYERLPHFCFLCGHMSHVEKDCLVVNDEEFKILKKGFKRVLNDFLNSNIYISG